MVAAAKLRRAQSAVIAARPYSHKISELIKHLAANSDLSDNPFVKERWADSVPARVAIVVVTADRGFCGAFNSNIIKATNELIVTKYREQRTSGNVKLMAVGKKGSDFFSRRKYDLTGNYAGVFSHEAGSGIAGHDALFVVARKITSEMIRGYFDREYDRVEIVYNEFKNVLQQRLLIEQFLPIPKEIVAGTHESSPHEYDLSLQYIYEPDSASILESLMPRHLEYQIWRVLLESNAAAEGARMAAMENASENAGELISTLSLQYNKARQAAITKELLEVVSGAEALTAAS